MALLLLSSLTGAALAGTFPVDSAVNINQFQLTQSQRDMLRRNGFVVVSDSQEQLFELYVSNWWDSMPSFVTTDLMLQAFHLCVNSTLRRIEEDKLYFRLAEFSLKMSDKFGEQCYIPALGAYFGVACRLLGVDSPRDAEVESLCQSELALIEGHVGRHQSAIFPFELDYSQFVPRGHYTRSDRLKRYFEAMMWYGQVPFPLDDPDVPFETRAKTTYCALSIATAMHESGSLVALWREIMDITSYFSGTSEAYTPSEYMTALFKICPNDDDHGRVNWEEPGQDFMDRFAAEVKRIREPKIHATFIGVPTGSQFRVFGQRYVPDTDIMQRLVKWPERPFPRGLDVFAALGAERAEHILTDVYREQDRWPPYPESLARVKGEFARKDTEFWYRNVYSAWLYALQVLNEPVLKSAPQFMQNEAWQDKSLNTSCGSWSELRHDAILYAQGTLAEADVPNLTKGYVEPNPEFYGRLLRAVETIERLLAERNMETGRIRENLLWFRQTLSSLQAISRKELEGTPLSDGEVSIIWDIGNAVEGISCRLVDENIEQWHQVRGTDRFMACVADVATAQDKCLEVGVAAGNTICAFVPIEGKWTLTRGAAFSYREFEWPAGDRLTDEKWQRMVWDGKAPPPPVWTKSYTAGE